MSNRWATPEVAHFIDYDALDELAGEMQLMLEPAPVKPRKSRKGKPLSMYNPDTVPFSDPRHRKPYRNEIKDRKLNSVFETDVFCPVTEGG